MLEHNLRAQQKYNKFTVHGKLQSTVSKLKFMNAVSIHKFMNAVSVQCFKGYSISCVMSIHWTLIQPDGSQQ